MKVSDPTHNAGAIWNKSLPRPIRPAAACAGPALIALSGAFMLWLGWRRWADLLVDFGNQLYVPWQISEGQVLYRDLFYVFGPLSSYLHAGLFRLFGPGAIYLSLFNIALTFLLAALIYILIRKLSGNGAATLASLMFLTVHALGQHKYLGNYNFIQPYSYDLTHGMFLSFLALLQVQAYLEQPGSRRVGTVGLLLGLVLLTKIEVMVAAGMAVGTGLILAVRVHRLPARRVALHVLLFTVTFVTPFLLFLIFFSFHMPLKEAFADLLLPWRLAMDSQVHDFFYFKKLKGVVYLRNNLYQIFLYAGVLLALAASLLACDRYLNKKSRNHYKWAFLITSFLIACLLFEFREIPWRYFLKPLPLLMLAFGVFLIYRLHDNFSPNEKFLKDAGLFVLTVFALALMIKIFFRVVVGHYGFALSLPGALVTVVLLVHTVPQFLEKRWGPLPIYRITASSLLLVYILAMSFDSYLFFSKKQLAVGKGPDLIYDYHPLSRMEGNKPYVKGFLTKYALEFIEKEIPADAEMAVLPDAIMFNYLSRHRDPAKGFLLNPMTWVLFDRDAYLLRLLRDNPPPYIVLVDRSYFEFDLPLFGKDYGRDINRWIQNNYVLFNQIGATPFTVQGFGIQFYKRKGLDGTR